MGFIKANTARLYAVLVALLALVAHYVPDIPSELFLGVAAAILGAGEVAHRSKAKHAAE